MMMDGALFALTLLAALGSGLIGGVFFAFSTFIMAALGRLPAPQGIAAMQTINVVVLNPWFLGVFFGTGVLCLLVGIAAAVAWPGPAGIWLIAGAAAYLAGTIGVTMACNVPLNNALAAVAPEDGTEIWKRYLAHWTVWNHVRTACALLAAALFISGSAWLS